jgi:hypothetical protein
MDSTLKYLLLSLTAVVLLCGCGEQKNDAVRVPKVIFASEQGLKFEVLAADGTLLGMSDAPIEMAGTALALRNGSAFADGASEHLTVSFNDDGYSAFTHSKLGVLRFRRTVAQTGPNNPPTLVFEPKASLLMSHFVAERSEVTYVLRLTSPPLPRDKEPGF